MPARATDVAQTLSAVPGVEVHAVENGKIVVVIEADGERSLAASMDNLRKLDGVLAMSLVYHYAEPQ